MSDRGAAIAAAALTLVGTPFRLHGRDPALGLDCVGVIEWSLGAAGITLPLPRAYGWRNRSCDHLIPSCENAGGRIVGGPAWVGDIVLARPGPGQHHLLVMTGPTGFVHAHASLRRVVHQPGAVPWPIHCRWRFG
ncbi:hypothetical protein F7D01_07275 [Erythrobacter sp. 3-20A1M]|uniref:NlpC/P60 family protein n=1 Tax=Erythrobacter sp. 3-20A1M TaxID=2653850 RepID=UPI001BFC37B3|nr:NlpC/P60 family protein [Erythrobacter sp. 3-20A1M]QWC56924.1 hypothetical protein F7D01_07275 [Erythrobacter sp. 3-20A1M]